MHIKVNTYFYFSFGTDLAARSRHDQIEPLVGLQKVPMIVGSVQ